MYRILLTLGIAALLLAGCSATRSFEARFEAMEDGDLLVNCSDEVNRGKRAIDAIGYVCRVQITEETKLSAENGRGFDLGNLQPSDPLKIILTQPRQIAKEANSRTSGLVAEEIVLLNR